MVSKFWPGKSWKMQKSQIFGLICCFQLITHGKKWYLLIFEHWPFLPQWTSTPRSNKTKSFLLWNTKNAHRSCEKEQLTFTHHTQRKMTLEKLVRVEISDTLFFRATLLFTNPSYFMGIVWTPPLWYNELVRSFSLLHEGRKFTWGRG